MNRIASSQLSAMLERMLLAVLVMIVLLGSAPVSKARAWQIGSQNGRPGLVTVPTIYISDIKMISGLRQFTLLTHTSGGPTVYRSPATTGAQTVVAVYVVEKWNGYQWVNLTKAGPFYGTIGSAQTAYRFPAPYLQPMVSRGYFRVSYIFSWAANGVALGGAAIISNTMSDHFCSTPYRLCQTYNGYFRTGGEGTGTW